MSNRNLPLALKEDARLCRGMVSAQEAMIKSALEPLGCLPPFDHHAAEWAADQIGGLYAENAALTARVQALEGLAKSIFEAPMGNFKSVREWKSWAVNRAYQIYHSTPAADLSAHDEAVRRDALEQVR